MIDLDKKDFPKEVEGKLYVRGVTHSEYDRLLDLARLGVELATRVDECSKDGGCEACGKLARALRALAKS